MRFVRNALRVVALASLVVGALATGTPQAGARSDVGAVTVTWPDVTAFNSAAYDYIVDIGYNGPDQVVIRDTKRGATFDSLSGGRYQVAFYGDGISQLAVFLCHEGSCDEVAESPLLQVYGSLHVPTAPAWMGPATSDYGNAFPRPPAGVETPAFDVDWQVSTPPASDGSPGTVVAEGAAAGVSAFPPPPATAGLVDGRRYVYSVRASMSGPEWGSIAESKDTEFRWDSVAPAVTLETGYNVSKGGRTTYKASDTFYPIEDGTGDKLMIDLTPDETVEHYVYEVVAGDGSTVARHGRTWLSDRSWQPTWDGREFGGLLVPAGAYRLVLHAYDRAGNLASTERRITVSYEHERTVVFRHTYSPAKTQYDQLVGKCSRLEKPARPNWPGSIGYMSGTPCSTRAGTEVVTAHAVRVPWSNLHKYLSTRVSVTGGKATGARSYLVILYLTRNEGWDAPEVLDDNMGVHPGRTVDGFRTVLGVDEKRPTLVWEVGNANGAKYDVKSFTVTVKYRVWR